MSELTYGLASKRFVVELRPGPWGKAVEATFELDLSDRPTMVTVRGQAREDASREAG